MTDLDSAKNTTLINKYIENDENEKAVDLLYKLALQSAKKKDFVNAEAYRDRLYEVDSMALARIVEVNEVIEAEKRKALTPDIRRMWGPFFQGLTSEEAGSFFFALKEQHIEGDQVVLKQGQTNDRLYLVHQGNLKVVYQDKDKELLIQRLGSGDIFGADTFFSVNVCTATIKTLSAVRVSFLERTTLENLTSALEFLESNLKKVCCSGASMFDMMHKRGIDRRSYRRINLQTKVTVQLLSSDAKTVMRRPLTSEVSSKPCCSLYSASSCCLRSTYSRRKWILEKRSIISGVQKRMLFTSIHTERLMRRPPDISMPRQFLNASEISA